MFDDREICGTCRKHIYDQIWMYFMCTNPDSEHYAEYTEYTDTCDEWEEQE